MSALAGIAIMGGLLWLAFILVEEGLRANMSVTGPSFCPWRWRWLRRKSS